MMGFMRWQVYGSAKGMSVRAMIFSSVKKPIWLAPSLYLVAETYYQLATFEGMKWGSWADSVKQKWDIPMNLGDPARKAITGNTLDYYVNLLKETREKTLAEFRKRDDQWLMAVDKDFPWGPTNNYCKWFHVCRARGESQQPNQTYQGTKLGAEASDRQCLFGRLRGKSGAWTPLALPG